MERITTPSNYPPSVGKFRDEQIANRMTWKKVPDREVIAAAMHSIHTVPANGSTVTEVNPLDPATTGEGGWLERPGAPGTVVPARSSR